MIPRVCECKICIRTKKFVDAFSRVPEQDKEFWNDIYNKLFYAEEDGAYYRAIVEGSWPSADEIIANHRQSKKPDQT